LPLEPSSRIIPSTLLRSDPLSRSASLKTIEIEPGEN
jgi:hypothetical protein